MARNNCSAMPLLAACLLSAAWSNASAQEIEPRAYSNAPIGVNFLVVGYAYTEGGLAFDPAAPLTEPKLSTSGPVMAFARSLELFGKSAKFDVILPYSFFSAHGLVDGQPRARGMSGLGDPRFRFSINLLGAPALSVKEFAAYQQDLIVGVSMQVSAPLGQYDNDKLDNGNNDVPPKYLKFPLADWNDGSIARPSCA